MGEKEEVESSENTYVNTLSEVKKNLLKMNFFSFSREIKFSIEIYGLSFHYVQ